MDLTQLAGMYRFCLPPYMVFIIRSVTTLDFCAVRTNCNMYELAAPVAIWRALTPRTDSGRQALRDALLTETNQINWDRLQELGGSRTAKRADGTIDELETRGEEEDSSASDVVGLLKQLLVVPEGAALRRVAFQANPKGMLPPPSMRAEIVEQLHVKARKEFKARIRTFSLVAAVRSAVKALFNLLSNSQEKCKIIETESGRALCEARLRQRRRVVTKVLLRSKLASRAGLFTSLQVMALVFRVGISVMVSLVMDLMRDALKSFVALLASPLRLLRSRQEPSPVAVGSSSYAHASS
uniref:Uncharacterized protein n=1 Tax=Pyramimonas obovata TaxID=1411642 RepID=A0A7S0RIP4_9CHLO|mmetsp:Transcript_34430/g.75299  ORF Transcript_34430/g.75299 Transcript_34430/m.75299 type:complete len:297 (+) Transcript_34430:1-891(+)